MKRKLLLWFLLTALLGAVFVTYAQDAAPDGMPLEARHQRFIEGVSAPDYPATPVEEGFSAQATSGIPANIVNALRRGGYNLVFSFYDVDTYNPHGFDADLPRIAAEGAGHVRLVMSMDAFEQGTTGRLREERYQDILAFVRLANSYGLVVIVDSHNVGMRECAGCDWTHDYMGRLREPAVRARHLSLMTELVGRLGRDVSTDWFVFQPANEPIEEQPWRDYQPQLFAALRQACASCTLVIMAWDWQGIDATLYGLNTDFIDAKTIVDVHVYDPLELTHCAFPGQSNRCGGLTFPGTFTDWRGTGYWDGARLESMMRPLVAWKQARGVPFIHVSEFGTAAALADAPRTAYMCTMIDIFRRLGFGFTIFEWRHNFGQYPQAVKNCAFSSEPILITPPAVATTPPAPTAVPPTADRSSYPHTIQTTDPRITVVETAPPTGTRRTFTVLAPQISGIRRVMLYSGDRWLADDTSPPYTFSLEVQPGETLSALVVYTARDEYHRGDFSFEDAPPITQVPPATDTPVAPPTVAPTVAPTATSPAPTAADFAEVARILRQIQQLYGELADSLAPAP